MWETIKKILQKQGGTCIIIEEGKPVYVVSSFSEYQRMLSDNEAPAEKMPTSIREQDLLEKINQEITNWKSAQAEQEVSEDLGERANEDVRIEDLPL